MPDSGTLLALVLVLASAFAHATWNLCLKRAQRQEVFVWWLSAAGAVGAAPVAVVLAFTTEFDPVGLWFIVASALVHICYFLSLGRSLARAESLVSLSHRPGFRTGSRAGAGRVRVGRKHYHPRVGRHRRYRAGHIHHRVVGAGSQNFCKGACCDKGRDRLRAGNRFVHRSVHAWLTNRAWHT